VTFGECFAGIGGLGLGLERAGMECRWQIENDPFCNKILQKHWPRVKRHGDIRTVSGHDLEPVDLFAGGFPCTDLSQAGKRVGLTNPDGTPTRSGLWFEFARIIGELRPRYVLVENVPGLLVYDGMRRVIGELSRYGYVGIWRSLRASEFGASHLRKRIFIVATLADTGSSDGRETERFVQADNVAERRRNATASLAGSERDPVAYRGGERCDPAVAYGPGENVPPRRGYGPWPLEYRGSSGNLADTGNGLFPQPRRGPQGRDGARPGSAALGNADDPGLEGWRDEPGEHARERIAWASGAPLEFAPGPSDPRWPRIIRERPDLAPALANPIVRGNAKRHAGRDDNGPDGAAGEVREPAGTGICGDAGNGTAQAQSQIRGIFNELPDRLDGAIEAAMSDRTKRLGRLGNAVVPACAQWLGERILRLHRENEKTRHLVRG